MDTLGSDITEPAAMQAQERVPLSGEKLELALKAMESPGFLDRLTARIMKLARQKGFQSPFRDEMDLPGGKSAGDLAGDILEKSLDGSYTWDQEKHPQFFRFCLSRAESILSNWLARNWRVKSVPPLQEREGDSGEPDASPLHTRAGPDDLYAMLRVKEGGALGDRFMEDFAFSLQDGSHEQAIALAVFDDRECANRAYCRGKLNLSEADYDAAVKRLGRKLPVFAKEWRAKNNISLDDWKEAR